MRASARALILAPPPRNLLANRDALDGGSWTRTRTTVTPDAVLDPWGGPADRLVEDTSTNTHTLLQTITTGIANRVHQLSVAAKADGRNVLRITDGATVTGSSYYDLTTGAISVTGNGNPVAVMEPLGDGWWLCVLQIIPTAGTFNFQLQMSSALGTNSYTGTSQAIFLAKARLIVGTSRRGIVS